MSFCFYFKKGFFFFFPSSFWREGHLYGKAWGRCWGLGDDEAVGNLGFSFEQNIGTIAIVLIGEVGHPKRPEKGVSALFCK